MYFHFCYYLCFFFFCFGFYVPLENFSLIKRCNYYRWRASKFDLCSALMAMKQWGSFGVQTYCGTEHPYIMVISEDLWHNTPVAEHLAVELSITYGCRGWDSNTQPSTCRANAVTDCATAVVIIFVTTFTSLLLNNAFVKLNILYLDDCTV